MNNHHISVVIPVYGCSTYLYELYFRLKNTIEKINPDFEFIFINDASPDGAWNVIVEMARKDSRVKGINLSRNFGQHYAITAGLDHCSGEWIIVMDCDLQDQPEEIFNLYKKAQEGWNIVYGRRYERKDKLFKRISSRVFHFIFQKLSNIRTDYTIANFGIYSKLVIDEYKKMKEQARSFTSLINYLGFKSCSINVKHNMRYDGKSSYTFKKLIRLSIDVILSNSNKPLKMAVNLGLIVSMISFLLAIYNIIAYFTGIIKVPGFTTTVFSIWFVGGLIMLILGILGLYIGKIFDQVKGRQLYIISEKINL